ncbi:MAG: response regulator [Prosthecobacter sp.]|nr:response regulator [Prosthecobacter sp.]
MLDQLPGSEVSGGVLTSAPPQDVGRQEDARKGGRTTGPNGQLEAIGGLASGIAQEFSHVLAVIQSQMDMVQDQASGLPAVTSLLSQVMTSARHAAHLSRKLVALAPSECSRPGAMDLTGVVDEEAELLRETLGEQMSLKVKHESAMPLVWADPSLVSRAMVNVAVHARAAMPEGGILQITTRKVEIRAGNKLAHTFSRAKPGDYVMLTIEDTNPVLAPWMSGYGSGEEDRLTWVRETIESCGGALNATLIPGSIRLYQMLFPIFAVQPAAKAAPATILVVDDDEMIRLVIGQVLGTSGHQVFTAGSADEGWRQWRQHRGSIKLVITDINMPGGADGVALGQVLQEEDPSVPVIYTSGYRAASQFAHLKNGINYLAKPFGMLDLLKVVERNLASVS